MCFNIEDKEQLKLNNRQRTDVVKTFYEEIEKAGYYAVFYCNLNWLNNYLYKNELLPKYDLWLGQWQVTRSSIECGIWQKSDHGSVYGINGNVDLNIAYKDYPQIMKNNGLKGFKKEAMAGKEQTYIVKKSDTLSAIAAKYGVNVDYLVINNNIKSKDRIYPDQVIKI